MNTHFKHIIYEITNLSNNMLYVGKHTTNTPQNMKNYWGSSKRLKRDIKKQGKENFRRETLLVFDTEEEAYTKEREIVTPEFVARRDTYNLVVGGKGNGSGENHPSYGKHRSEEIKKKISISMSGENGYWFGKYLSVETKQKMRDSHVDTKGQNNGMFGRQHSEETKKKISISMSGEKHHMYGKYHTDATKEKMRDNHWDCSGENNFMYGKHHTEVTKEKMSLSIEIVKQRREDVKNISKVHGWKAKLGRQWGISGEAVYYFIKKYASDLI